MLDTAQPSPDPSPATPPLDSSGSPPHLDATPNPTPSTSSASPVNVAGASVPTHSSRVPDPLRTGHASDSELVLAYTDLLGTLLQCTGVLGLRSRCGLPAIVSRWLVLVLSATLVVARIVQELACDSRVATSGELERYFFVLVLFLHPISLTLMLTLVVWRGRHVLRPLETSQALVVSVTPATELDEALERHRDELRAVARRYAQAALLFLSVLVAMFNTSRVAAVLTSSVEAEPSAFTHSCQPALAEALSPAVLVLALIVSDAIIVGNGVVAVALTLWLLAMYDHDVEKQGVMVDALADEIEQTRASNGGRQARRASRLFGLQAQEAVSAARSRFALQRPASAPNLERRMSLALLDLQEKGPSQPDASEILKADLRCQLDFLQLMDSRFIPLGRVVVMFYGVAIAATGLMIVPASVRLVQLRPLTHAVVNGFMSATIAATATSIIIALGYNGIRHHQQLTRRVGRLLEDMNADPGGARPLLSDSESSDSDDDGSWPEVSGRGRASTEALTLSVESHSEPPAWAWRLARRRTIQLGTVARFWTQFRSMYGRLLLSAVAVTAITTAVASLKAKTQLPSCVSLRVHRDSLLASEDASDCAPVTVRNSYVFGALLGTSFGTVAPFVVAFVTNSMRLSMVRDMVGSSFVVVAACVILEIVNGYTVQASWFSRPLGFLGYTAVACIAAYRLVKPGDGVPRAPLPTRAAWLWVAVSIYFVTQVLVVSGLVVFFFALATNSVRFLLAFVGFPAVAMVLRFLLDYLCEEFQVHSGGAGHASAALYTIGHLYLSLIGRSLLVSLGVIGEQFQIVLLWTLAEIAHRAVGHLARPAVMYALLPPGERRVRELARAEQGRLSTYLRARIYGRMFSEVVAICCAVALMLALRAVVPEPDNPGDLVAQGVSTGGLFASLIVQLGAEACGDFVATMCEENVLERDVLAFWNNATVHTHLVSVAGFGLFVSIVSAALQELVILAGRFQVDE